VAEIVVRLEGSSGGRGGAGVGSAKEGLSKYLPALSEAGRAARVGIGTAAGAGIAGAGAGLVAGAAVIAVANILSGILEATRPIQGMAKAVGIMVGTILLPLALPVFILLRLFLLLFMPVLKLLLPFIVFAFKFFQNPVAALAGLAVMIVAGIIAWFVGFPVLLAVALGVIILAAAAMIVKPLSDILGAVGKISLGAAAAGVDAIFGKGTSDKIGKAVDDFVSGVKKGTDQLLSGDFLGVLRGIGQFIWDLLAGIFTTAFEILKGIGTWLWDTITGALKSITTWLGDFGKWLLKTITDAIGSAPKALSEIWDWLTKQISDAAKGFAQAIIGAINGVLDFLRGLPMIGGIIPADLAVPMAQGGIVSSPTLAMIGERGPEAVVPLDKAGGGFGGAINITLNDAKISGYDDTRAMARDISRNLQYELRRRISSGSG